MGHRQAADRSPWKRNLCAVDPEAVGARANSKGLRISLVLQVAVVIMCLVSIILYRAVMAIIVSRSDNTFLSAWVSLCCMFF